MIKSCLICALHTCSIRRASAANTIAVAEKKVAILTKALDYHPGNTQLLLAMLEVRKLVERVKCSRGV